MKNHTKGVSPSVPLERQQRQAEALRANLARRKNQTRARRDSSDEDVNVEQQGNLHHGDHA